MEVVKRKRKSRPNKLEFLGWGSKPLIEFLQSIGRETRQYSQHEVAAIVNEYVTSKNLLNPKKKRRVLCDERLRALFRKKSIARTKIYHLLDVHFIENHDESEDDSSEAEGVREEEKVALKIPKEKKTTTCQKKEILKAPRTCFAALTPQNIKLIYLKRSLVQDLLKNPESFEDKIVGSFVRINSDPNYHFKKHFYQLQQVIGVRQTSGSGDTALETRVQLLNLTADVPISLLSDANFLEEECEELQEQVKAGLLKRPTVEEFELKAQVLHKDITKHWIDREIRLLQHRIDHANEKGWRRELFEYLERKQLLSSSTEQERLFSGMPKVVADEPEPDETPLGASEKVEEENSCTQKPEQEKFLTKKLKAAAKELELGTTSMGSSEKLEEENSRTPVVGPKEVQDVNSSRISILGKAMQPYYLGGNYCRVAEPQIQMRQPHLGEHSAVPRNITGMQPYYLGGNYCRVAKPQIHMQQPHLGGHSAGLRNITGMQPNTVGRCWRDGMGQVQLQQPLLGRNYAVLRNENNTGIQGMQEQPPKPVEIIDLNRTAGEDPDAAAIWHGVDHRGSVRDPVSLNTLRMWFLRSYLDPDFRVWKTGQSYTQSVLLVDVLNKCSSL